MCYIKRITTVHRNGPPDTKDEVMLCANSIRGQTCENTLIQEQRERSPRHSHFPLPSSPSSPKAVILHHDVSPKPKEPPQERHYEPNIYVRFRGLKSPILSMRKKDDDGSGRRRDGGGPSNPAYILPEAPMPPPAIDFRPERRLPPPSGLSSMATPPVPPMPPQGPAGAVFTTKDTVPSSSGTPSRTSSSRSRDAHKAVQDLTRLMVPSNGPRQIRPGLSRMRFDASTKFHDSAYGSSNISPTEAPKTESNSETRSTTTSGRSANDMFNYTNDIALRNAENTDDDDDDDDGDKGSRSSKSRKSYRIFRRAAGKNNPEETERKMQENLRAATDYQYQASELGEGSVRSGSGSGRRRRHRSRVSDE